MDLETWTRVLGLKDLDVVEVQRGEGGKGWRLSTVPTSSVALCPHCKKVTGSRHMVRWQPIHDLPIAGEALLLDMQAVEFSCKPCGKSFTVHPACVLEGSHVTIRLAEAVTDCVNVSTLSAAAATFHLPERTVKGIFEQIIERRRAEKTRTLKPMTKLGIDEIHCQFLDEPKKPPEGPSGQQRMTEPGGSTPVGKKRTSG